MINLSLFVRGAIVSAAIGSLLWACSADSSSGANDGGPDDVPPLVDGDGGGIGLDTGNVSDPPLGIAPDDSGPGAGTETTSAAPGKLDVLFVIDNSAGMATAQDKLVNDFTGYIDELTAATDLPDLHIGVISTDVGIGADQSGCSKTGDDGRLRTQIIEDVCAPMRDSFIIDRPAADGTRERNYRASLGEAFACSARLAETGCGFEQPLESLRRALDDNWFNQGFLREDAKLAIIFLTNEDDCSASGPELFSRDTQDLGRLGSFRCFAQGVYCPDQDTNRPGTFNNCVARPGAGSTESHSSPYMTDVGDYIEFVRGLKSDPSDIAVYGIMGDTGRVVVDYTGDRRTQAVEPGCVGPHGSAAPAIRLQTFVNAFSPDDASSISLCYADYRLAFEPIGRAGGN